MHLFTYSANIETNILMKNEDFLRVVSESTYKVAVQTSIALIDGMSNSWQKRELTLLLNITKQLRILKRANRV